MQTTERITVTLPKELAEWLRQRVESGDAESVSALVASYLEESCQVGQVKDFLAEMEAVGGPPTVEDEARVDELLRLARGA